MSVSTPNTEAETAAAAMEVVHVAVGVIFNQQRQVLIARRHKHAHQGDLWEFPGGKLEPGENVAAALRRELKEELGIEVLAHCPLKKIAFEYPDKSVMLDVHTVTRYEGAPCGQEGQPLAWSEPEALVVEEFPAANRPIIQLLRIPELLAITTPAGDPEELLEQIRRLLRQGIRLIQLRQPQLHGERLAAWSTGASRLCADAGAGLMVNCPPELFPRTLAQGLHLNSDHLLAASSRPVPQGVLLSASCHDLQQLRKAEAIGVDFALLSPVKPTATHPEALPLGWEEFARLAAGVSLPVFALGGVGPGDLPQVRSAGGQGIAAVSAFASGAFAPDLV